jgi:hypothetical protein
MALWTNLQRWLSSGQPQAAKSTKRRRGSGGHPNSVAQPRFFTGQAFVSFPKHSRPNQVSYKGVKALVHRKPCSHSCVVYHGTPNSANAGSIIRDGWMVGPGNGLCDGLYFALDKSLAKGYAGGSGVYLVCRVWPGRTCLWDQKMQQQFQAWCQKRQAVADNSAKTSFLLQLGFSALKSGNVLVILQPQLCNSAAGKTKSRRIKVLSVHRATDDKRIRV